MSTGRDTRDNLPTVTYNSNGPLTTPSESASDDTGASEARKLSDKKACGETGLNEKSVNENPPEFSPTFVKIPFDDIELGECCGEGSFGTVYKAKWVSQGKDVAVKTLNRMDEEVRILSTLSHRNIIQFYGACCEVPNCCLVTEYAPYGSLFCFLASPKSEHLEFAQMLSWARDVALGMNYLHEEAPIQVVHRDLKSKNVLICQDFSLKICDFGASRVFDETTVMTITGTYPWMAPELIQGLPTSEMCDVYSFGVVLWELLTKEVPFKGLQGFQVAWNVVEKKERPLIPTSCPKTLSHLMQRCWQAEANERPPFCDISHELNQMLVDGDLEKETDSFVNTKCDWIVEVKSKLKDIKHQESKLESERKNVEKREEIMKQWAERLENELKQKSLFNFQFSTTHESLNCEFSGTTTTSTSAVKEAINKMMFSSGLHRHSKDDKFGRKLESVSPNDGTSPLFGVSLSRQGSTSSMESSRSMSMHSDMTYDMSKVNLDSSPVSFMESPGSGRSRMKLQKQMSTSSEEFQYEGMKISRENTPSNGNGGRAAEWEKASAKSKSNQSNESLEFSSQNYSGCIPKLKCGRGDRSTLPSLEILEKALRGLNLKRLPISDTSALASQLYERLEIVMKESRSPVSPLSDDLENSNGSFSPLSPTRSNPTKKSPPYLKNMPPFPSAQKPPLNFSPTKIMDGDDIFNTVRHRPKRCYTRHVETQTQSETTTKVITQDSSTQTCDGNKKRVINYLHHVPSLERVCTDAHKSGAREYITVKLSQVPSAEPNQPNQRDHENIVVGQVFDNAISRRNVLENGVTSKNIKMSPKPALPKSLSLDEPRPEEYTGPDTKGVPRHVAAQQVYLASRASSASGYRNDIYETDDFTYIIRPNRRRLM